MQEANAYLEAPVWKPSIGTYSFPQSSGDHFKCVAKIQNAIVDLRDVRDKNSNPHEIQKFRLGGAWSNPKDVKAISSAVFDAIMNIHKIRLRGIAHRHTNTQQATEQNQNFTFHQRLHWTAFLLQHYKEHANLFMNQLRINVVVARI